MKITLREREFMYIVIDKTGYSVFSGFSSYNEAAAFAAKICGRVTTWQDVTAA